VTEPVPANARGLALIIGAVILGALLLSRGFDDGSGAIDIGAGPDTDASDTTETQATLAGRPPAEVSVLVANASGVAGVAGNGTAVLAGVGYLTAEPTDAPAPSDITIVYFQPDFEVEARAVAETLGADPENVQALNPAQLPVPDVGTANVVAVIGADLSQAFAAAAAPTQPTG